MFGLPFHFLVAMLCGWLQHEQQDVIAFLREENRALKARLKGRRLRFDDQERRRLGELGDRNAHAERFVRSIKTECLDRVVPLGERHLRHLVREFVAHYREERHHQGIGNELIEPPPVQRTSGPVYRRQRLGGVLNYDFRSAA